MRLNLPEKISIALIISIFIVDLFLPLGITVGTLYVFCILLIGKSNKNLIYGLAFLICFLILLKFQIYYEDTTSYKVIINRVVSVLTVMMSAVYSAKYSRYYRQSNEEKEVFKEKERNFNALIENMIEGAQIISKDFTYLYVNQSLCKQAGVKKTDLIGKKMSEVYPGIEKTHMFKQLELVLKENKPILLYNEFTFPNGHTDFFELNIQPIPEGVFIMSMMINDKVKLDNERKHYVKELEEMLYMTSHMIRQPITNIVGLADQLDLHENLSVDELKQINFIKKSAMDLDMFTHDLNDFILTTIKNNKVKYIENEMTFPPLTEKETAKKH